MPRIFLRSFKTIMKTEYFRGDKLLSSMLNITDNRFYWNSKGTTSRRCSKTHRKAQILQLPKFCWASRVCILYTPVFVSLSQNFLEPLLRAILKLTEILIQFQKGKASIWRYKLTSLNWVCAWWNGQERLRIHPRDIWKLPIFLFQTFMSPDQIP